LSDLVSDVRFGAVSRRETPTFRIPGHLSLLLNRQRTSRSVTRRTSAISFTRDLNADYRDLIDGTPPEVLDLYDVGVDGDRAALTFDVLNVRFVASAD